VEPFWRHLRLLSGRSSRLEFEEIAGVYAAYGGELWRALLVVSGGRADLAQEATAEAFARLVANADDVRESRGWLYRTGYRVVVDELRREGRGSMGVGEPNRTAPALGLSPELVAALRRLPPAQRLVVFLTYQAGMSVREVAELTGAPVATVKVRLHRARRALRVSLVDGKEADARA
jgi:RNA polymerase sigma-70 factor (ECF subfamily)